MAPWQPPELPDDPDANAEEILDGLQERLVGWVPNDGDPLAALGAEVGRDSANLAAVAGAGIATAVAGIGETVFGVPALQATAAVQHVELTLSAPDTIGPDFVVVGTTPGGAEVSFSPTATVALPAGVTQLMMTAITAGEDGNGVPLGPLTIATATATVVSAVAITAPSDGGSDAETLEQYLDRLTETLSTLRFGGVTAADMAALSRGVTGVHRAFGVDLHNPADPGTVYERTVTVFPVGETGQPVSAGVKANLDNYLQTLREVNFIVHVADPTYTAIAVTYDAVAEAGYVPAAVKTEINVALGRYLSPASWGSTPADPQAWTPSPKVRFLEVSRVIGSVPGVAYVSALTINGGIVDVTLAGAAPLPAANATITGTVV